MNPGKQVLCWILLGAWIGITSPTAWSISLRYIQTEQWGQLDVVWIEDNSVPTFSVQVYFADGALSDHKGREGETDYMLTGLFWGTNRFNQKEISNNLEYFGVQHNFQVFHEYSTLSYFGLAKDIVPVTKKYCHLFADSIYPKREVKAYTERLQSHLGNMVTDHSRLANHVFRRLSMRGTVFEFPVEGTLSSVSRMTPLNLARKRDYFNRQVKKTIYLRGGREILKIKDIIQGECRWGQPSERFVREVPQQQKVRQLKTKIVLIPVPGANQAQIRMGRFLNGQDIQKPELLSVMSGHLGGNFISVLNRELRTKRGLVYSVGATAQGQKYYGRSVISTFSRTEKVRQTIEIIKSTINSIENGEVDSAHFKRTVNYLKGGHLFQFESYDSFLRILMFFQHTGRDWNTLYEFPQIIERFSPADVAVSTGKIFSWDDSLVVVVGHQSLLSELQKIDSTQTLDYKSYL